MLLPFVLAGSGPRHYDQDLDLYMLFSYVYTNNGSTEFKTRLYDLVLPTANWPYMSNAIKQNHQVIWLNP